MARLPRTAKRRLARSALASLGLATILVPLIELATSETGALSSWWWRLGVALWLWNVVLLVICLAVAGRISRPIYFYGLEKLALWPGVLVLLLGGIRLLRLGLGPSFVWAFAVGLVIGLVALPLGITFRAKWIRQAISEGHLSKALNIREATWDPRFDADHVLKDPRMQRSGCLLSLLFWAGPALGLALSDIVGQANALVIAGLLGASMGYVGFLASGTDLAVLSLELQSMERRLNRRITLEPEFIRGG